MLAKRSSMRLVIPIFGSLQKDPMTQVKYGHLIRALQQHLTLINIYDASLKGLWKLPLALAAWHPVRRNWRERYVKHPKSFEARSQRVSRWVSQQDADAVLQFGALFDSCGAQNKLPNIIYTDYTSYLSAKFSDGNRSPYKGSTLNAYLALEKQAYVNSSHLCVRSQIVRKSLINDYNLPPEKITVIGGGANLNEIPEVITRPIDQPPRVLFIGQNFYRKGGDLVLKAFAEVRKFVPESRLTMVTHLPKNHGLPLTNVDIVEMGFNREIIHAQLSLADVFILPSRLETWGDVILEAMAYGIACIGVTGQPMEEIILHGKTGLLTTPENPYALCQAMLEIISDRTFCHKMGMEGRKRLEKEYTWPIVARRLSNIIEEVVANVIDR